MLHFLEFYFALGIILYCEKSYATIKKINATNLTCTVSAKVRLSSVQFLNKKILKCTVLYRKQS